MNFIKNNRAFPVLLAAVIFFASGFLGAKAIYEDAAVSAEETNIGGSQTQHSEDALGVFGRLIFIRTYTGSETRSISEYDAYDGVIGKSRSELEAMFSEWEIESFSPEKVVFTKQLDSYPPGTYKVTVVPDDEGVEVVGVYTYDASGSEELTERFSTPVELYGSEEAERLRAGIIANDEEELARILEIYE